ncbi:MAG: hypothetical protein H7Y31_12405 [Chitinophagaceae bacterium]|nr:hypothetical protein [Chitinophagaceae bacterium]
MIKSCWIIVFAFFSLHTLNAQINAKTGKIEMFNGRPTIFVNNQPMAPIFYSLTHAYTGRWSWEENPQRQLKNFCETGIRLFQLDLYFEDIWFKNKKELDLTKARKQVQGLLEVCPDANIVIRVHVNAPFWWNDEHPEELTNYVDGPLDTRNYGPPFDTESGDIERPRRASLASMNYRAIASQKLIEFCKRMSATPEGASIIGLHISSGVFGEWHYWGYPFHEGDNGKPMTAYFRNWLKKKYGSDDSLQRAWKTEKYSLSTATVPDTTERMYTTNGIFRDPSKERRVIDYFNCQQEVVADDIEHYCKLVKDNWPRQLIVGVFYGYFHMTFSRQAVGGHLYVERIMKSPYVDYLSAPQSYYGMSWESGGPGHSRGVIESARLNKKLFLDELDNGGKQDLKYITPESMTRADPKYIPMLRRSALMPLTRGMGFWYYDFGFKRTAGWWDSPVYLENIKEEKKFFDTRVSKPFREDADALMVWDMESFFYVYNKYTAVSEDVIDKAAAESYKTGASIDHVYLFDLPSMDLSRYKAIIFMNVYQITAEQRKFIKEKVAINNRTIVWNYMPGVTDGVNYSTETVEAITEMNSTLIDYRDTPVVRTGARGYPSVQYRFNRPVHPLMVIEDSATTPLGFLAGTDKVVIASRKFANHSVVYGSLPIHDPQFYKEILRNAGVHIYNEVNSETTVAKDGLIWIYTLEGGKRTIRLRNGKTFDVELPAYSTTLFDADTGAKIFK